MQCANLMTCNMEDIAPYTTGTMQLGGDWSELARQALAFKSLTRALCKIKVKLTVDQLRSLYNILQLSLSRTGEVKGLFLLSDLREHYMLSQKLQRRLLNPSAKVTLSLTISEAATLYNVIDNVHLPDEAMYEANLIFYIISEMDKQTV